MVSLSLLSAATAVLAGVAVAAPTAKRSFSVPSDNGFPSPNAQQLLTIENEADGTLSNAPPPGKLANSSLTAFQLIAFNENFEVAFFNSLLQNVSNCVPGYEHGDKPGLISVLKTVIAQEELHAINAEKVLTKFGVFPPPPCTYKFPTTNLPDALALAETFTSVVLGTLQDASQLFATNGDTGPVRAVASVIGQEGEQNGFYRTLLKRKPSQKPFLTTSVASFAFSALQGFIDQCPFPISQIPIPIFPALNVLTGSGGADVDAKDQTLTFSTDLTGSTAAKSYIGSSTPSLFITYFTGQNLPISVPISSVSWAGNVITFDAAFPFTANVMEGLSIASLTTSGNFSSPDDVPAKTLAAPGLIQVNDKI